MKTIKYTIPLLFIGISLLTSKCNIQSKAILEAEEVEVIPDTIVEMRDDQIRLAGIEFGSIEMKSIGSELKVNGVISVAPQNLATVSIPLGGFVRSTTLLPGDEVRKGQVLAMIENQEFIDLQREYLEARNKLAFAKAEYDRHSDLYKEDVYSEQNIQEVTVEYKNLVALVKSLEQKLLMIGIDPVQLNEGNIRSSVNLVSPINGYIKTANVNLGKSFSPSDVLFEIVNCDKLLLELTLFEKDAELAAPGQKIRFFVNNGTNQHEAEIIQTGKSVSDDKTIKVFATVNCKCKNVLPGMYVNASIESSNNIVPSLPSEAIVSFDDKDYIFIFDKNKEEDGQPFTEYRIVEVKRGNVSSGYTEVTCDKKIDIKSAKVVVKGAYNLLSAKKNAGEMAC
ncbi:MAG TPA: efflux RND transporter periplasmic adaptor subunit [Bacteroidales bacterium]|nr:efflux RND transporter periplasmic adaptor subunit [Bacteroidales bacterium]